MKKSKPVIEKEESPIDKKFIKMIKNICGEVLSEVVEKDSKHFNYLIAHGWTGEE